MSSTNIREINLGYYEVGSIIEIPVDFVKNNGPDIATGVTVAVDYPTASMNFSSFSGAGAYSDITKDWTVGTLVSGEQKTGIFYFEITDDCPTTYSFTFTVSTTTGCESCLKNNILCVNTVGVSCCSMSGCDDLAITTITDSLTDLSSGSPTIYDLYLLDASSNTVDIILPSVSASSIYNSSTGKGKPIIFKAVDFSNAITIAAPGGAKIVFDSDVASALGGFSMAAVGDRMELVSNGTNYYVIRANAGAGVPAPTPAPTAAPTTAPTAAPTTAPTAAPTPAPA